MKMNYKKKIAMALSLILTTHSIDYTAVLSEEAKSNNTVASDNENKTTVTTTGPVTTKKAEATTVAATTTKKAEATTTVAATTTKKAEATTTVAATTTKKAEATTTVAATTTKKAEATTVAATTTKKAEATTTVAATTTKKAEATTTVAATTTKKAEATTTTNTAEVTTSTTATTIDKAQNEANIKAVMDKLGTSVDVIPAEDGLNFYKDDVIDIKDAQILRCEDKDAQETVITNSADIYVESVECIGGDSVAISVGVVDWTQDIESMEINFEFDKELSLLEVDSYGNMQSVIDGNKIKVYGFFDMKAAYRGRIATFIFEVPQVDDLTEYAVSSVSGMLYSSNLEKYVVNLADGKITADSSLAPTNVTSDIVNSKSVHLKWNACKNQDKYSGYIVFRNGEEIGRTAEAEYSDSELETGKEYVYSVQAYDDDGRTSPLSREYKVVPEKVYANGLSVKKQYGAVGGSQAEMAFSLSSYSEIASYKVYAIMADESEVLICDGGSGAMSSSEVVWNLDGIESGEYAIKIVVTDIDGTVAENVFESVSVDKDAPAPVESLIAFEADECVSLTWAKSEQFNTAGYKIYRRTVEGEYECIGEIEGRESLAFTDKTAVVGTDYFYNITAYDCFGQEGEMTTEVASSSRADQTAPQITLFMPKSGSVLTGDVSVTAKATDNIGVAEIVFFISEDDGKTWKELYKGEGSECVWKFDTTVYEECDVKIKVIAYDKNGNESNGTNINSYHIDNKAPEKVSGLSVEEVYDNVATLKWNDVSDKDRKNYIVEYKAGEKATRVTVNTIGANLGNLVPDTQYTAVVYAVDINGNISEASEPLVFTTLSDMHAPKINSISPYSGYCDGVITLKINAIDNQCVKSVDFEISKDGKIFELLAKVDNKDNTKQYTAVYELDTTLMEEGSFYIRGIATDANGNRSSEGTLVNEYIVNRSVPEKVENVTLNTSKNRFEIVWSDPDSETVSSFNLYRKGPDDEDFVLFASGIRHINYFDGKIELNKEYSYKVSAVNVLGREGELSEAVTGVLDKDVTAPEIKSIYPEEGTKLSRVTNFVSVLAYDNVSLKSIVVEYFVGKDGGEYKVLDSIDSLSSNDGVLKAVIPQEDLKDKNVINIRTYAIDKYGNKSEYAYAKYVVDDSQTEITEVTAEQKDDTVTIKWQVVECETTEGYYIYRKFNDEEYRIIGSIPRDPDVNGGYMFEDVNSGQAGNCTYKITAVNSNYNKKSFESNTIEVLGSPEVILGCDGTMEKNVEYKFDVSQTNDFYGISEITIDYGDGTTEKGNVDSTFIHKYTENGNYKVVVTAVNKKGISASVDQNIEVTERKYMGKVDVTVKKTDGSVASGIYVYCDVGTGNQVKMKTDNAGRVSFYTTAGTHNIGVYADGYLPVIQECIIVSGSQNPVEFSVVEEDIITAEFDIQRMTLDEIKAVGIDVDSPMNQHMMKVNVRMKFTADASDEGTSTDIYVGGGYGTGIPAFVANINIDGGKSNKTPKGRKLEPVAVVMNEDDEVDTIFILDIPVEASFLKDFFDVKLHIINNASSEFSMYDNIITLDVPDGLSLVDMGSYNSYKTYVNEIKGQTQKTLNWIIRGDEGGEYKLKANYEGTLSKFNEKYKAEFESDSIHVTAPEDMSVTMTVPNYIKNNDMYIKVEIANNGTTDMYNVKCKVGASGSINTGGGSGTASVSLVRGTLIDSKDNELVLNGEHYTDLDMLMAGNKVSLIYHVTCAFNVAGQSADTTKAIADQVLRLIGIEQEMLVDSGIQFSLNVVDDERKIVKVFDRDSYADRLKYLKNENKAEADMLINGESLQAADVADSLRDIALKSMSSELQDDLINLLLDFNIEDIKQTDKVDYIDNQIIGLIASEDVSQSVSIEYFNKMLSIFADGLDKVVSAAEDISDEKDNIESMKKALLSDTTKLTEAMNRYNSGGSKALCQYIEQYFSSNIGGDSFKKMFGDSFVEVVDDAFGDAFSSTMTVLGIVNDTVQASEYQWAKLADVMLLQTQKEHADKLLKTLENSNHTDPTSLLLASRAKELRERINDNLEENIKKVNANTVVTAGVSVLGSMCSEALTGVIGTVTGPVGEVVLILAGAAYGEIEEDIDNKYFLPARIMITDSMCDSIAEDLKVMLENDDEYAMRYMEYISKLREEQTGACVSFLCSFDNDEFDAEYITTPTLRLYYEAIVQGISAEELMVDMGKIQQAVDKIFVVKIPDKTAVNMIEIGYDYLNNRTDKALTEEYEYRVDGGKWSVGNGYVYVDADDNKRHTIEIRMNSDKGTAVNYINTIRVKERHYLTGDLEVRYVGGRYIFDSMCSGKNLRVLFSNSETVSEADWKNSVAYNGTSIIGKEYKYVHVRESASHTTPASQTKTAIVVSTVNVLIGKNEGGKVSGAGKYDIGKTVTVYATPDAGYEFGGWVLNGQIVSTELSYKMVAKDDVTIYARFISEAEYKVTPSVDIENVITNVTYINGVYVISAHTDDESIVFSHWEDENGEMVSLMKVYAFVADRDITLKAVYIPKTEENKANEEEKDGGEK